MPSPELSHRFAKEISRYTDIRNRHLAYEAGKGASPTKEEYDWIVKNAALFQDLKKGREPLAEDEPRAGVEVALDALRELYSGENAWRAYEVPSPESLGLDLLLDEAEFARLSSLTPEQVTAELDRLPYVQEHFPSAQSETDTAHGLTRHRPSWWGQTATLNEGTASEKTIAPTWGLAYVRSIASEIQDLRGSTILMDTATKPRHIDGSQHYGSPEGTDPSLDPLLPLFQEVFGEGTNRFNHTFDELQTRLLPVLKAKIEAHLVSKGLSSTDFDVILAPFHTDQAFMENDSPESSSTNTWEWTGTPLMDANLSPTGHRFLAGYSDGGGSGCVFDYHPSDRNDGGGARLAVVVRGH